MRIGELARQAGVSTRTLRHYEELGLLTPRRTANSYRDYADAEQPKRAPDRRPLPSRGHPLGS